MARNREQAVSQDEDPPRPEPEGKLGQFNPRLFAFDAAADYPWMAFEQITVATVTWNRLPLTQRFLASVLRCSHLPFKLLIVDNASDDGTQDYLRGMAASVPTLHVIENARNVGLLRALQQIRDHVADGLIVYCDNDMEVLSNYWLVLILKAFHAVRLARGRGDAALGLRVLNLDEYGFRYASRREVLRIPADRNALPRTSYAAASKDAPDVAERLVEEVVIGWTEYLMGGAQVIPASVFRQIRLENAYPRYVGGTDAFMSAEFGRLGVPMGYIENGPVVRHNDWPYSEDKIQLYGQLTSTRAVTDLSFLRWKFRDLVARFRPWR